MDEMKNKPNATKERLIPKLKHITPPERVITKLDNRRLRMIIFCLFFFNIHVRINLFC